MQIAMDISNETSTVEDVSLSVQSSHPIGGPEYLLHFPHLAYPYLLIAGCASVFGTLGNVLVLCSVGLSKSLHHHRNVFLVNLAMADLCVTSFADPLGILGKFTNALGSGHLIFMGGRRIGEKKSLLPIFSRKKCLFLTKNLIL